MEFHEVANIFPMMNDDEYNALVADIKAHGQLEPVWLYQGKIIDGRNRYKACLEAGIEPQYRTWEGDKADLITFILSLNLQRRHLTSSQKAMIAVEVEKYLSIEAKKNMSQGGKGLQKIANPVHAAQQAAALVGTNHTYVTNVKKVMETAPELGEAVRRGDLSIPDAVSILRTKGPVRQAMIACAGDVKNGRWPAEKMKLAIKEAVQKEAEEERQKREAERSAPGYQERIQQAEQERLRKWEEDKQLRIARDDAHIARAKEQLNAPETASARAHLYEAAREAAPLLVQGLRAYLRFLARYEELMGMVKVTEEIQLSEKYTIQTHPRGWPGSMYQYESRAQWIRKMVDETYHGSYEDFLAQVDELEEFYEDTKIPSINLADLLKWIEEPSSGNGGDEDD